MRKIFSALLPILLLAGLFSGCSSSLPPDFDYTNGAYVSFDLSNVDVQEVIDTLPKSDLEILPDEVIAETDMYIYYRTNGNCYLNFKSGNHRIILDIDEKDSCGHRFTFGSIEKAYQWLCAPVFDKQTEEIFRHCWPLDAENGFIMPDPQRLYIFETPEEYLLDSVDFYGDKFSLIYKTKERLASGRYGAFTVGSINGQSFTKKLKNYYRFDFGTPKQNIHISHSIRDDNASVYEYETTVWKERHVHYLLEDDHRTVFYEETYLLAKDSPEEDYHFAEATVFACEKGIYYTMGIHYSDWEPFLEVIPKIELVLYVTDLSPIQQ